MQRPIIQWHKIATSLSNNLTTNIVALAALIFSILSYQQSKKALSLQLENRISSKAEYAYIDGAIFQIKETCDKFPTIYSNVRILITNIGSNTFSIARVNQINSVPPDFYAEEFDKIKMSNGKLEYFPIKVASGESVSMLLPISFPITPDACKYVKRGTPCSMSLDGLEFIDRRYYEELDEPYRKAGKSNPYAGFMNRRIINSIEYIIQGEENSRIIDVSDPNI